MHRRLLVVALPVLFGACAQDAQQLPFAADAQHPAEGTVSIAGGTVTSASAGTSVTFPAGALAAPTDVSIAVAPAPAFSAGSGSPSLAPPVVVEPAGTHLSHPASIEFDATPRPADRDRAWLTSVLIVTPDSVGLLRDVQIDGTNGIGRARTTVLGTLIPFIPSPAQYVLVTPLAPSAASVRTASTSGLSAALAAPVQQLGRSACGTWAVDTVGVSSDGAPRLSFDWLGCDGFTAEANQALLDQLGTLALQFVHIDGAIVADGHAVAGEPAPVHGSIAVSGVFRSPLQIAGLSDTSGASSGTAGGIAFSVYTRITATADTRLVQGPDAITLTHVLYSAEKVEADGSVTSDSNLMTLVLPIAADGRSALLTVSRTVDLPGGTQGTGTVSVRLDLGTSNGQ